MPEDPSRSGQERNLELPPLFGLGRRRRRQVEHTVSQSTATEAPLAAVPAEPAPVEEGEVIGDPLAADPVPEPSSQLTPASARAKRLPPVPPATARRNGADEPASRVTQPVSEPAREVAEPTESAGEKSTLLSVAEHAGVAAALTGALVGLVGAALTVFAERGCEAARGVSSCGGIGVFALLVILAVEVVLGAAVLQLWRVDDPFSTSFLAVGLVAVFVLLFLLGSVESGWMFVAVPLISALAFLLSWWVTEAFTEAPQGSG